MRSPFQNGTPSATTCCIADWCPFAYRCYRRSASAVVGGVRLRYADSAVFFFSGLTPGYSLRSKFYRECGVSGLLETSGRKSLVSDSRSSIIRSETPVVNLQRRGFSFSSPNIFRLTVIANSFFVRDDRHADGWRTLFGFSFFRHFVTVKSGPLPAGRGSFFLIFRPEMCSKSPF